MSTFYKDKRVALWCHLILALTVLPFVLLYPKNESLLYINGHHNAVFDHIMYHTTRLPELAFIVFIVILGLFAEKRKFLAIIISLLSCVILILLFKEVLFSHFNRPFFWLSKNDIPFHKVDGIRLHTNGSFPSGHTISAFCALAWIGFLSKKAWVQVLMFLIAVIAGYSRIYVAQHYLMDVYAGALIGFSIAYLCHYLAFRLFKTPYWNKALIQFKP